MLFSLTRCVLVLGLSQLVWSERNAARSLPASDGPKGDGSGFVNKLSSQRKRAHDSLKEEPYPGSDKRGKRSLDSLDGWGFCSLCWGRKRSLDSLDGEGFCGLCWGRKSSLDSLDGGGFGGLGWERKRSLGKFSASEDPKGHRPKPMAANTL
ncbi:hypothetical protein V3C99_014506 [Haemonchus contortus]